jgi:hypothetical protein
VTSGQLSVTSVVELLIGFPKTAADAAAAELREMEVMLEVPKTTTPDAATG